MIGIQNDFAMHSGDNRLLVVTVKDENDVLIDITAAAFTWALSKADPNNPPIPAPKGAAVVTKTVGSGITITDGPNGVLEVQILPADTETIDGAYYHELQMTLGGAVSTVAFGNVTIYKDLIV